MNDGYVLLVQKEEMWARVLMEVLEDNHVPCTALPVYGAGFALKTGAQERLNIYVPSDHLPQAKELAEELFCTDSIPEDEEMF